MPAMLMYVNLYLYGLCTHSSKLMICCCFSPKLCRVINLQINLLPLKVNTISHLVFVKYRCICTLLIGPLPDTTVDFWHLVWQEKPNTIVMVTNLVEDTKIKCHQYWPNTGTQSFGSFRVTITDQKILADYTIRGLLMQV